MLLFRLVYFCRFSVLFLFFSVGGAAPSPGVKFSWVFHHPAFCSETDSMVNFLVLILFSLPFNCNIRPTSTFLISSELCLSCMFYEFQRPWTSVTSSPSSMVFWVSPDRWAGSDLIALAELSSGAANVSSVKQAAVALRTVPLVGYCHLLFAVLLPAQFWLELLLHSALQLSLSVVPRCR